MKIFTWSTITSHCCNLKSLWQSCLQFPDETSHTKGCTQLDLFRTWHPASAGSNSKMNARHHHITFHRIGSHDMAPHEKTREFYSAHRNFSSIEHGADSHGIVTEMFPPTSDFTNVIELPNFSAPHHHGHTIKHTSSQQHSQ